MTKVSILLEVLYDASLPKYKSEEYIKLLECVQNDIDTISESDVDSLLFSIDISKLNFDCALLVLDKFVGYRDKLCMFNSFVEQCAQKFRRNARYDEIRAKKSM